MSPADRALPGPRATSVTKEGDDDGFVPLPGWHAEATPNGDTRVVVSVPHERLGAVLAELVRALTPPLGVLYRRKVDRRNPGPDNAPPTDHVALELPPGRVLSALEGCPILVASDARAELWIRGRREEQVVLDSDGLLYTYPDDPVFREAAERAGVPAMDVQTMTDRDYVKHWFRAEADAEEDRLVAALGLRKVPHRR